MLETLKTHKNLRARVRIHSSGSKLSPASSVLYPTYPQSFRSLMPYNLSPSPEDLLTETKLDPSLCLAALSSHCLASRTSLWLASFACLVQTQHFSNPRSLIRTEGQREIALFKGNPLILLPRPSESPLWACRPQRDPHTTLFSELDIAQKLIPRV